MTIDVYTATGSKKGTATLPKALFEAPINEGLMHQALVRQQSNRRVGIAHAKSRGEIQGSTRKLFAQKGTGRARRGSVRSPLLRGGNKAFGPRSDANYFKDMPRIMRRRALSSCLSQQAKNGSILGLENYPDTIKTQDLEKLLKKLPVDLGRRILFVTAGRHNALTLSARNLQGVKTVQAAYLNPEDVLVARHIIFFVDALQRAEEVFGEKKQKIQKSEKAKEEEVDEKAKVAPKPKKTTKARKAASPSSSAKSSK